MYVERHHMRTQIHKWELETTAEDYMYRGMRSTHKVCERLPDPMMLEQDENGKFIPVK